MSLSDAPFEKYGALYIEAVCECGTQRDVSLRTLETGKSIQCKACHVRDRHVREQHLITATPVDYKLRKRAGDWFQRCNNPRHQSWHNYGGRGIQCKFGSVREAVEYIKSALPHPHYVGLELDRTNNDGHYEPGNIRLVTKSANLKNKRRVSTTS